ncbi:Avirulence protein (Avh) [Phytophthora palmivora]|uniref:Avirulence protein (Avh) n=1 Tax=Phytophthora palmivora TaxID=4796 RepID=A0A2P4XDJ1_9STRA|nr:Avirulence protein (Avh) [Phytophthora palmivora]
MQPHYLVTVVIAALFCGIQSTAGFKIIPCDVSSEHLAASKRNDLLPKRFLRSDAANDEDGERGGISVSGVDKLKSLMTSSRISAKTLDSWLKKEKSPNSVFVRMGLDKAGSNLFDNPQLASWVKYTEDLSTKNSRKAISPITTLSMIYSDEALAQMIVAAKTDSRKWFIATKLEAAQMQSWLVGGKSADSIFTLFKLDKAGDSILSNPFFNTWYTYLKIVNAKFPTKKMTLFTKLNNQYGDEGLLMVIVEALKVKETSGIAALLRSELFHQWAVSGKSVDAVFQHLMVPPKTWGNILGSAEFKTWSKYVEVFNKENPDKQTTIFAKLSAYYSESQLSGIIEAAQKISSTESIGLLLERDLFQRWIKTRASSEGVFTTLMLDKAGNSLFAAPQFATFTKYTDIIHVSYQKSPIVEVLRPYFDDFHLVTMIMEAEKIPSSLSVAKRMEEELIKEWMISKTKLDEAWKALRLDKSEGLRGVHLFDDPMFNYWMKFLDKYNKVYHGRYVARAPLISTYSSKDLINMIQAAKANPTTKSRADVLEKELLQEFMYVGKHPNDVAQLLKVANRADINKQLLEKYTIDLNKYVDYLNRKREKNEKLLRSTTT